MERKKIKVLIVIAGFRFGVSGGVASVLYNYCSHIDSQRFVFDYLALGYQGFEPYRQQLEALGGHLYCANVTTHGWKRFVQSVSRIWKFLKEHPDYDVIHTNSGALRQVFMMALAARISGCKAVVVHAHSAMRLSRIRKILNKPLSYLLYVLSNCMAACSEQAAASMFPAGVIKNHQWRMIPNVIDCTKFAHNEDTRMRLRQELGIRQQELVLGHVGRFNEPKNHSFLIDVFAEVVNRQPDARLLLVGAGDLMDQIQQKAEHLGILDRIMFVGQRTDVCDLLQAMDIFVFPSLFEGLGMSIIESQAAGVPTVAADTVPMKETQITDLIRYLPLGDAEQWADTILHMAELDWDRDTVGQIVQSGYDIHAGARSMEELYRSLTER